MTFDTSEMNEAVVLFAGDEITRELLYPEFEAILDGFIPVPDFKGATAKAVYLVIDTHLRIHAAVFFLLDFDAKGMVNRRWNVPVQQLAEAARKGPDLGAGPIRLACFSQCAIEIHQQNLWDPNMDPKNNSFVQLKKAVANNRMGLIFKEPQKEKPVPSIDGAAPSIEINIQAIKQKLHKRYSRALRDKLAGELKEQRLRVATLHSKYQETINKLQADHQRRLQVYQERLQQMDAANKELDSRHKALKESLEVQANKVEVMREYFSHKLKAAQLDESSQLQALQDNFSIELELKVQAATAELREMLDMREVELFYRYQSESSLKEEIVRLRGEYQDLLNNSGEQLLTRLNKVGVNFVVYHPGVGQFTIPVDDLSVYLENPSAFVARKAGFDENLFAHWFAHYQNPCCSALDDDGNSCGKPLLRIGSPVEFHEGESDRCEDHQLVMYELMAERRG